jgi:hypothetical protein
MFKAFSASVISTGTPWKNSIASDGFSFVPGKAMRAQLEEAGPLGNWAAFTASWNDLATDTYMADKGRYRKRCHAVFAADPGGEITRAEHQPHFQSLNYNPLNGGVRRWFEPIRPEIGDGQTMQAILGFTYGLCDQLMPVREWHIEAHQFRIEAQANAAGKPTPEGMHRDGVDYAFVFLIQRENIKSGTTIIQDLKHKALDSFTLVNPLDAALLDDRRVYHGVTPVEPLDPAKPAWRDVFVITFRAK